MKKIIKLKKELNYLNNKINKNESEKRRVKIIKLYLNIIK